MPPRKSPRPARKQPKQARSAFTVEMILDATIRILDSEGVDAATTTRIAEVAGVSVGTLYQYFADRTAILDALQDREFTRASDMLASTLSDDLEKTEREITRSVIAGLLALYREASGLHRLLAVDGLRGSPTERVVDFDRKIIDSLRGFFELSSHNITRKNRHAAAFVLYQSVRATLLAAILEEPAGLTDEALVEEVTDLVAGHLTGERAPTNAGAASKDAAP